MGEDAGEDNPLAHKEEMTALTTINSLNSSYVTSLLSNLLRNKLYRSEAQLQFDIAWQIKEDLLNLTDWQVCLEPLSATIDGGKNAKRLYTDIMVYNEKTKEFIPIELKYKTKEIKGTNLLKNHGAQDLGSYDFLWDVKRIEMLKTQTSVSPSGDRCERESELVFFLKGFAIMITNDNSYSRQHNNSCAKDFYFTQGKTFCAGTAVDWDRTNPSTFYKGTWRDAALNFSTNYICDWYTATAPNPYPVYFHYLVFETQ